MFLVWRPVDNTNQLVVEELETASFCSLNFFRTISVVYCGIGRFWAAGSHRIDDYPTFSSDLCLGSMI